MVLRKIGYIPGEQLPLEFGGMASDFTASGSASTMLREPKKPPPGSSSSSSSSSTIRSGYAACPFERRATVDASVVEAPARARKLMLKRSRRRNKKEDKEHRAQTVSAARVRGRQMSRGSQRKRSGLRGDQ